MPLAPLPANSSPRATPSAWTALASQVEASAKREGQHVTVPMSSFQYVRKPPAASCMFRLGMPCRATGAVLPTCHHFRSSHPSQPVPRSSARFSAASMRSSILRAQACASSQARGSHNGVGSLAGSPAGWAGLGKAQAPLYCSLRAWHSTSMTSAWPVAAASLGRQSQGSEGWADQQATGVPGGHRPSLYVGFSVHGSRSVAAKRARHEGASNRSASMVRAQALAPWLKAIEAAAIAINL
mmetsp:Transcript_108341/g.302076  ORF Transcript_108341/g.302076 Transcript_108341/m.302076 type:complete len:240 (+) Transcript_108341:83-802(+)